VDETLHLARPGAAPLLHPELAGFGASPDGITEDGIMLEIKCPYSRVPVAGEVPKAYRAQVQGQLEVCGLEECDFLECRFEMYFDEEEFLDDAHPDDPSMTADGFEKGALMVPLPGEDALPPGAPSPAHSDPGTDGRAVLDWVDGWREACGAAVAFWRLSGYNLVRVRRDRAFFEAAAPRIEAAAARLREPLPEPVAVPAGPKAGPKAFPFLERAGS
jgi:hypothetical protein